MTVTFANAFQNNQCPTTTGDIEANYATLVNHNFLDETKICLIKIAPYHCESGAINITAKIKIKYECELEFRTSPTLGFYTMNMRGLANSLGSDDIWEMSAVPEYMWNVNRPRLLTMYKVGLTYNHTNKNINVTRITSNPDKDVDNSDKKDVRQLNAEYFATKYDPNPNQSLPGIPPTFTPPNASTPVPTRYKMKKGTRPKPYPARAQYKNLQLSNGTITADGAAILGQSLSMHDGTPEWDNFFYKDDLQTIDPDTASADTQDKTLTD